MEEFYLEKPSIKREKEIIEYCEELVKYNSDINGIEVLTGILHGQTFQETLDYCLKLETEEYAKRLKKAQVKTYLLVRKSLMGISVMELSQLKEEKDIARLLYT